MRDPSPESEGTHLRNEDTRTFGERLVAEFFDPPSDPGEVIPPRAKYEIGPIIGRGGIGVVHEGWDRDLQRDVALKFLRPELRDSPAHRHRFVAEARIIGLLQHPGIVPMYEIGSSEDGVFLAMQRVRGSTLANRLASRPQPYGDQPRLISILEAACQAIAYAHLHGVIHRDLKPSNILIGEFGEVQVIDWGLAKVLRRTESDDSLTLDGRTRLPEGEDAPSLMSGVIGTPAYMAPEQATRAQGASPQSDVFALGAILFEILTGAPPLIDTKLHRGASMSMQERAERMARGLLEARARLMSTAAPELLRETAARCLAVSPDARPEDAGELATMLRKHLDSVEQRARQAEVSAHAARQKQRFLVILAATLLVSSILGAVLLLRARQSEDLAQVAMSKFGLLTNVVKLDNALARASLLYPAWPHRIQEMEAWFDKFGNPLVQRFPELHSTLASVRANALEQNRDYIFAQPEEQFLHDTLETLVENLNKFTAADGQVDDLRRRLQWARHIDQLSIQRHRLRWNEAITSIRRADGTTAHSDYSALEKAISPQTGLVPLGMNPHTKLWEFYHLRSAADPSLIPERNVDGYFTVGDDTGVIFVLLPGGKHWLGAQAEFSDEPFYVTELTPTDMPLQEVVLDTIFVSAYEVTQGQWLRLSNGKNPSMYHPDAEDAARAALAGNPISLAHPVDMLNWSSANQIARQHGLRLPTAVEWEYACRARTTTPFHTGIAPDSLEGYANVLDVRAKAAGIVFDHYSSFDDGYAVHAPVGSYKPNGYGLFDMHGNQFEWCDDASSSTGVTACGGAYHYGADSARVSRREPAFREIRTPVAGARFIRALQDT